MKRYWVNSEHWFTFLPFRSWVLLLETLVFCWCNALSVANFSVIGIYVCFIVSFALSMAKQEETMLPILYIRSVNLTPKLLYQG